MKNTGRTFLCLLAALALVLGSLAWGARKGWQQEAQELQKMYQQEGGLKSLLELRAADASNLLAVARRHLDKQDDRLQAVARAQKVMGSSTATLHEKHKENQSLTEAVGALSSALKESASLQADTKDWNYVVSLTKALEVYADGDAVNAYNNAARKFNLSLEQSFSGWFAALMGVQRAELFD